MTCPGLSSQSFALPSSQAGTHGAEAKIPKQGNPGVSMVHEVQEPVKAHTTAPQKVDTMTST